MRYNIKARLMSLERSQVWLIKRVRLTGERITDSELSKYLSGAIQSPKSERVLELCDEILTKEEASYKEKAI